MANAQSNASEQLIKQLEKLQEKKGGSFNVQDVLQIIEKLSKANTDVLYSEIRNIVDKIHATRDAVGKADISGADDSGKISKDFIPTANLELEAIVKAAETATNNILDEAEKIQKAVEGAPKDVVDAVNAHVGKIFESCNFQDITGQRVSKVVKTLVDIEQALSSILPEGAGSASAKPSSGKVKKTASGEIDEKSLMNGPQLNQPSQEEIDKLFDSL